MMTRALSSISSIFRKPSLKPTSPTRLSQTLAQRIRAIPNSERSTPYSSPRHSFTIDESNNLDELCSLPEETMLSIPKNQLIESLEHLIYRDGQKNKSDDLNTALEKTRKRLQITLNPTTRKRLQDRIQELDTLKSDLTSDPTLSVVGFIGWTNQKPTQTSKEHRFSQYDAVLLKTDTQSGTQYSIRILNSSGLIHGHYMNTKLYLKKLIPEKSNHFEFNTPDPNQTLATKITINPDHQSYNFDSVQNYLQVLKTTLDSHYNPKLTYYIRDLFELKKQLLEILESHLLDTTLNIFQELTLLFLDIWLWRHSNVAFISFETTLKNKLKSIPKEDYSTLISISSNDPSQRGIKTEDQKVKFLTGLIPAHSEVFSV